MRTTSVRALPAALAAAILGTGTAAAQDTGPGAAPTIDEAVERATFRDWRGRRDVRELADGTTLSSYAGETSALDGRDAALRIGFVPRFGCTPGIELVVAPALAARLATVDADDADGASAGPADDDEARFAIDGTPVGYPVLRDEVDGEVTFAFNGNERERVTLRLQLDVGDIASLGLVGDGEPLTFSLLGSRRTLAAMESLCLTHEPIDPEADPATDAG